MVLVTTERSAAGRQLEEQQIIANVGTYSKAVGGEKMLGLEMMEMVSEQLRKCRTPPLPLTQTMEPNMELIFKTEKKEDHGIVDQSTEVQFLEKFWKK